MRKTKSSLYYSVTIFWVVYPKLQSVVVDDPLLLQPKMRADLLLLDAIQLHACKRKTSVLVWGLVPDNILAQMLVSVDAACICGAFFVSPCKFSPLVCTRKSKLLDFANSYPLVSRNRYQNTNNARRTKIRKPVTSNKMETANQQREVENLLNLRPFLDAE